MKTLQIFNSEYGLMVFPWGSFGGWSGSSSYPAAISMLFILILCGAKMQNNAKIKI